MHARRSRLSRWAITLTITLILPAAPGWAQSTTPDSRFQTVSTSAARGATASKDRIADLQRTSTTSAPTNASAAAQPSGNQPEPLFIAEPDPAPLPDLADFNPSDIVARVPNVIVKLDRFGSAMAIHGRPIAERVPCKPEWPLSSLRNNEQGTVKMKFFVDADGFASHVKLAETSGFRDLDRATMMGMLGCRFKPRFVDGQAIGSWISIQYVWTQR